MGLAKVLKYEYGTVTYTQQLYAYLTMAFRSGVTVVPGPLIPENPPLKDFVEGCGGLWDSLLTYLPQCNVPEATYNRALSLFKDMLPDGNQLVRNFYDTKKIPSKLDLPREKIHACKNHCMLFYGKVDSVLTKCKVCGHSRYKKGRRNNVPNLSLIKELKTLWNDGVETYDAYRKNNFNIKATLLWTVSDFPTYAMLSGWSTHEEVTDLEVGDAYMKVSENEEEFVDTYENSKVNEAEEEFIDRYDDSDDKNELALSDHSSDEDEESWLEITIAKVGEGVEEGAKVEMEGKRGKGRGINGNIGIGGSSSNVSGFGNQKDANYDNGSRTGGRGISRNIGIGGSSSNVSGFGNQEDENFDNGSRSGGRGRGISRNIGIGGSSSNVSSFGNQEDANCDNGSRSRGRGRGISRNIGIGGSSSNVSGFGNQEDANCDNGSRSEERGRGISRNIGIGGSSSNVSGFGNQEDANYDNGSISGGRGRGRGRSGNISGGSNVSRFRNQDADYDNGSRSGGRGRGISGNIGGRGSCCTSGFGNPDVNFDTNDNETEIETSQRVRGSNLVQSIPNHPSQRPMITLYYGSFAEPHVTRDIIKDLYQWNLSENGAVYKALERVVSSRYSDILGQCRRDAAHRATMDNITVGNDLSAVEYIKMEKKSNVARQNRLTEVDGEVSKHTAGSKTILQHNFQMRPVSLLEAYHRTHTSTNVSYEASGSRMDEASVGRTREYVTASSKRVSDAVEAAIMEKHGPDVSGHPPNDFDLWERLLGGEERMDEASEGRMREYVTASSKRVADAVEAAIMKKHGPDVSEHLPNDFDLWERLLGGGGRKVN
nr:hypothetical protein [Tanacetum cinerariifolium]